MDFLNQSSNQIKMDTFYHLLILVIENIKEVKQWIC